MDPAVVQKLLADVPEIAQLRDYLLGLAQSLDSIADIQGTTYEEVALETRARQRAHEIVSAMVAPLVAEQTAPVINNPEEYVV